jgi:hypothetical protein
MSSDRYSKGGTAQATHKGGFKSARDFYCNEKREVRRQ